MKHGDSKIGHDGSLQGSSMLLQGNKKFRVENLSFWFIWQLFHVQYEITDDWLFYAGRPCVTAARMKEESDILHNIKKRELVSAVKGGDSTAKFTSK